jgi:signal transduction histidine kinase
MGGSIEISSTVGQGTAVSLYFKELRAGPPAG